MDSNQSSFEKRLDEFDFPNLVLSRAVMENMLGQDERLKRLAAEKGNYGNNCVTALLAIISPIVAVCVPTKPSVVWLLCINIGLLVLLAIVLLWNFMGWLRTKKELKLEGYDEERTYSKVLNAAIKTTKYTAVILIASKEDNQALKFLCRSTDSFLFHCPMEPQETVSEQVDRIKKYIIDSFGISYLDVLDIRTLEPEPLFTIKLVSTEVKANVFLLFTVRINEKVRNKIVRNKENYLWRSIDEMKNDPKAMKLNYDIIEKLDNRRGDLSDSFQTRSSDLHVIWNITKQCKYACEICATADPVRHELTLAEKLDVLSVLYKEKSRIKTLDFAGGDPCCSEESQKIIQTAVNMFGEEVISVTTTAEGIQQIDEEKKQILLTRCEITIDASHENLSQPTNFSTNRNVTQNNQYNKSNTTLLHLFSDSVRYLTINIPILDGDLSDKEIDNLTNIILNIQNEHKNLKIETHLIRLMPVGSYVKHHTKEDYLKYNPIHTAKKIKAKLESNSITCEYHCSFRVLDSMNCKSRRCSMLEHKIGIDCAGNVFACAWGAYLSNPDDDITKNPFYLGNLTQQDLSDILSRNSTSAYKRIMTRIGNQSEMNYCEVVSYFFAKDLSESHDPLSHSNQIQKGRFKRT